MIIVPPLGLALGLPIFDSEGVSIYYFAVGNGEGMVVEWKDWRGNLYPNNGVFPNTLYAVAFSASG